MHQEENSTCISHVLFTLASKKPKEWAQEEDKILIWLASGNVNKYLGFPINYNMPQKEKDNKILQSIRGKQVAWMFKKLSFVAKKIGGESSDPCVYLVCSFMCKLVTFCDEKGEIFDQELCLVKPSRWKSKGKGGMGQYYLY